MASPHAEANIAIKMILPHFAVTFDFITGNKLTFNAAFATPLAGPYATGNYAPTQGVGIAFPSAVFLTPLTTFLTGKNIKGVWKLKVYDCGVGDQATLNAWKLKFDAGALQ